MQMIALHKNGLDVFSVPCYFFALILPALQGSAAVSAVRCSMERIIPSSVLPLSQSSSFFTAKLLVPVRQMMHPRQLRLVRSLFKFPGGILVRIRCGGKAPTMGRRSAPAGQIVLFRSAWLAPLDCSTQILFSIIFFRLLYILLI